TDERTVQDLANLWDSLRLRGPQAVDKANEAVAAFENGVTQQYQIYWLTRQRQADPPTFDPNFTFKVTPTERKVLAAGGKSDQQIADFEAFKTAEYHQLNDRLYGTTPDSVKGGVPGSFVETFRYHAATAERDAMFKGSSWTDAQLALSVGAGL